MKNKKNTKTKTATKATKTPVKVKAKAKTPTKAPAKVAKAKAPSAGGKASVSMSAKTYENVLKTAKRYSSKRTGVISRNSAELAEAAGCSRRTVNNAINKMIAKKVLSKEGVTKGATYRFTI